MTGESPRWTVAQRPDGWAIACDVRVLAWRSGKRDACEAVRRLNDRDAREMCDRMNANNARLLRQGRRSTGAEGAKIGAEAATQPESRPDTSERQEA